MHVWCMCPKMPGVGLIWVRGSLGSVRWRRLTRELEVCQGEAVASLVEGSALQEGGGGRLAGSVLGSSELHKQERSAFTCCVYEKVHGEWTISND